ncbi:HNH endonuclease domain-containing protein [Leeuwenhoekiella parthenopeia]|uniref:HNH nuclease domain-containing protein n=1 Tax=Leeuwenhoekiella parthenopeia TaxID=2890320 RepID=A0ABS8GXB3_9FLAO|nr:hypothetical protein [Leeuwenhoekiella parthenopeia]
MFTIRQANEQYAIDHVIPFSVWKNKALWNLLPSAAPVDTWKYDRTPAPEFKIENLNSLGSVLLEDEQLR